MLVSISRQQTTDRSISASMVQDGTDRTTRIVRANDRVATARTAHRTVEVASSCLGAVPNSTKHTIGKQVPEQFTLCSIAAKSTASSTQSSSEHTLRQSGDANTQVSVATSIASFASCAPTLTLSPSGSPKTRRNSFHGVRRLSTASSQSSDCPHCAADASVRSTIGYSDDEDESLGESTVTNAKKNAFAKSNVHANPTPDSNLQPDANKQTTKQAQNTNDPTSRRTAHGNASLPNEDRKKTAAIRRTYSLTKETRRKVVSMHMPSNFMLAANPTAALATPPPVSAPVVPPAPIPNPHETSTNAAGPKTRAEHKQPAAFSAPQSAVSAAESVSSSASSKSDENRADAEPTATKVGATPAAGQKQATSQRKVVPGASNVIAIKQSANANRVLTTSTAAAFASSPPSGNNFGDEISQSPAFGGKHLAELDNRAKASSHERLAANPAIVSTAQQPPNDKLLLPDKNLFLRKSQWSSESTLNILPQSAPQNPPVLATPKPLPQPLGNVNVAQPKQRTAKANSMEEADAVFDENHQNNNNNASASAHLPVKVSHVQQPLRSDKPASQVETTSRASICSLASKATRSKQQQYQAVYVSAPLQYQPSASSTLTTTASNFDETDIDVDWDDLSGLASDDSIATGTLKGQNPTRSTQTTPQAEVIGLVEAYEAFLNELDLSVQKDRQQTEQVRMGTISIECWRETARRNLQHKFAALEQLRKLLE